MRAMILAAGRGKRMGKLTDEMPKPLLRVGEHLLIEYALYALKRAGIQEVVVNVSYYPDQLRNAIGNGQRYGLSIQYSLEPEALETGGGIVKALPLLGEQPFIVMSADIVTDFAFERLSLQPDTLAHLVLVQNPSFHPQGDFGLKEGFVNHDVPKLTYANIGIYHPHLFHHLKPMHFRLTELLLPAIAANKITGEKFNGLWHNIGTEKDLNEINQRAREDSNLRPLVSETNTLSN